MIYRITIIGKAGLTRRRDVAPSFMAVRTHEPVRIRESIHNAKVILWIKEGI
jgi:hypothetical protein